MVGQIEVNEEGKPTAPTLEPNIIRLNHFQDSFHLTIILCLKDICLLFVETAHCNFFTSGNCTKSSLATSPMIQTRERFWIDWSTLAASAVSFLTHLSSSSLVSPREGLSAMLLCEATLAIQRKENTSVSTAAKR